MSSVAEAEQNTINIAIKVFPDSLLHFSFNHLTIFFCSANSFMFNVTTVWFPALFSLLRIEVGF